MSFLVVIILFGDPAVEYCHGLVVDQFSSKRRHLKSWVAGGDSLHETAAVRVPWLDAQHGIGRLPRSLLLDWITNGARNSRLACGSDALAQKESDVLQRALLVVTVATIAMHVAKSGTLARRRSRDPGQRIQQGLRQSNKEAPLDEVAEIDTGIGPKFGMRRAGIPFWR